MAPWVNYGPLTIAKPRDWVAWMRIDDPGLYMEYIKIYGDPAPIEIDKDPTEIRQKGLQARTIEVLAEIVSILLTHCTNLDLQMIMGITKGKVKWYLAYIKQWVHRKTIAAHNKNSQMGGYFCIYWIDKQDIPAITEWFADNMYTYVIPSELADRSIGASNK
jgi:hypothetical protein